MDPSPTFLESLKPQERYDLLQSARGDPLGPGALSGTPSTRESSRSGGGAKQSLKGTPARQSCGKAGCRTHPRGYQSDVATKQVTATQRSKCIQGSKAVQAMGSSVEVALERGSKGRREVAVRPPVSQATTQELRDWAQALSRDNTSLASEVMQLRALLAAEKENGCVLGDRVHKLQDLFVESCADQDSLHSTQQSSLNAKLEALATPEVLAMTRPPAMFPVPVPHEQQPAHPSALQEVEKLRRHLVSVQTSLSSATKERDLLAEQLEDSQAKRKAEKAAHQKQAAAFSARMLGTVRRLVYAADQISKKDESIKSLSAYIHRLEQQTVWLRKSKTKKTATDRRCHSHDTRTACNDSVSSTSPQPSDCSSPQSLVCRPGQQSSCAGTHKNEAKGCVEQQPDDDVAQQQQTADRQSSLEASVQVACSPASWMSRVRSEGVACEGGLPASDLVPPRLLSQPSASPQSYTFGLPINNSYVPQLQQARATRYVGGDTGTMRSSHHDSSGLTTVAEVELSVGAWYSPSIARSSRASRDIWEQPPVDVEVFAGAFSSCPDFTAGTHVTSTADTETWQAYMAAIDDMEQRIDALEFPPDIDSSLITI